jgi:hypothetical protein
MTNIYEKKITLETLEKCTKEIWKDPFIELGIIYINDKAKEELNNKIIEHINEMG